MPAPSLQRREKPRPARTVLPPSKPDPGAPHPIDDLIAEIARLQNIVIEELRQRRTSLRHELSSVDTELAELTGETATGELATNEPAPAPVPSSSRKRTITLPELIAALEAAPDRTLNIRKAGLEVKSIKALAKAHPHRLQLGGKGAWPTVTLSEHAAPKSPSAKKTADSHLDLFTFGDSSSGSQPPADSP